MQPPLQPSLQLPNDLPFFCLTAVVWAVISGGFLWAVTDILQTPIHGWTSFGTGAGATLLAFAAGATRAYLQRPTSTKAEIQ